MMMTMFWRKVPRITKNSLRERTAYWEHMRAKCFARYCDRGMIHQLMGMFFFIFFIFFLLCRIVVLNGNKKRSKAQRDMFSYICRNRKSKYVSLRHFNYNGVTHLYVYTHFCLFPKRNAATWDLDDISINYSDGISSTASHYFRRARM